MPNGGSARTIRTHASISSNNYGSYEMRGNKRWRHMPKRPRGLYMQYLDRLIEENRAKREAQGLPPVPDVADDEFWRKRREDQLMKDQPKKAA